jgi:2-polyprenyl-3-methyl-5-hydroxy-6-metoxy-1,4-benzoquinol methylase
MSVTREELDKTAQEYHLQDVLEDKHIEGACQEYSFTWVFDRLKPHQHVLEMGYGDGLFSAALHNRNISFSIVEGALSLVQEVQKRYPEVKIYHELFEAFTPAEQYDVILATHVLEHVDEPVALLKSMKAWLKPGGKIIVIVPNKDSIHRRLAVKMGTMRFIGGTSKSVLTGYIKTRPGRSRLLCESSDGFFSKSLTQFHDEGLFSGTD